MLDQLRDLWAERPAVVAAAVIAPIVFIITLLVLFLAVDNGQDGASPEQAATAEGQTEQSLQVQTATAQQTTVVVETSTDDAQEAQVAQAERQASAQDQTAADAEAGGQAQQQAASELQQSEAQQRQAEQEQGPPTIAGHIVQRLDEVLVEEIDPEQLRHGSDGLEGGILPIDNGIVVSSLPEQRTTWELIVPSAGLKSTIVRVGRTPSGAMGSPDNPYVIGWLDSSAQPGETGNALLAGHRDFEDKDGNVGTGVCWELVNTVEGDQMIVRDVERDIYYIYTGDRGIDRQPP